MTAAKATAAVAGLALVLIGVSMIGMVTGGRGRFGGWFLDERDRRKRKASVFREHPRLGPRLVPGGYALAIVGVGLFVWAIL